MSLLLNETTTKCRRETISESWHWNITGITAALKEFHDRDAPSFMSCYFTLHSCQWKAMFWPWGNAKKEHQENFSFFLALQASPQQRKQQAKITISIPPSFSVTSKLFTFDTNVDMDIRYHYLAGVSSSSSGSEADVGCSKPFGFKMLGAHKELLALVNKASDTLSFQICIDLVSIERSNTVTVYHEAHLADFQKTVRSKLNKDISLQTLDHIDVPANRGMLSARSVVLGMLIKNLKEPFLDVLDMKEWRSAVVQSFVEYACSATIPDQYQNFEETVELYKMAHRYEIPLLFSLCRTILIGNLNTDNARRLHGLAELYEDYSLRGHIEDYARVNVRQLLKRGNQCRPAATHSSQ